MSESTFVMDSSAILCVIFQEPGAETVEGLLDGASISAVNLSEVVTKLQDRGMPDDTIDRIVAGFRLDVASFDERDADVTGKLRNVTRAKGLSLGDRACLSLAARQEAVAVTTDRAWRDLDKIARVLLIG